MSCPWNLTRSFKQHIPLLYYHNNTRMSQGAVQSLVFAESVIARRCVVLITLSALTFEKFPDFSNNTKKEEADFHVYVAPWRELQLLFFSSTFCEREGVKNRNFSRSYCSVRASLLTSTNTDTDTDSHTRNSQKCRNFCALLKPTNSKMKIDACACILIHSLPLPACTITGWVKQTLHETSPYLLHRKFVRAEILQPERRCRCGRKGGIIGEAELMVLWLTSGREGKGRSALTKEYKRRTSCYTRAGTKEVYVAGILSWLD